MFLDIDEHHTDVAEGSLAEELTGKMGSDPDDERLPHSVLEHDEQKVKDGQLLSSAVDYALGNFTPDLLFEQIVERYRNAQHLYGPTIIRELTGYDGEYIEKNLKIAEFRERLKDGIRKNVERLKKEGLVDKEGRITEHGLQLAALVLYTEELDHLRAHGFARKERHERGPYGERGEREQFKKHSYRDIDVRASVRKAVRRGRGALTPADLIASMREEHGKVGIVYALDASGSMRGEKLHLAKKAGVALAHRAISDGNEAGLVIFTSKVERSCAPTKDFAFLLHELIQVRAGQETDLALAIGHALTLFGREGGTRHVVLLTDALPTKGEEPARATMEAVMHAKDAGVTLSLVGINLEKEGEKLAKRIVELGAGRLYRVRNLEELDLVVLEDYEAVKG